MSIEVIRIMPVFNRLFRSYVFALLLAVGLFPAAANAQVQFRAAGRFLIQALPNISVVEQQYLQAGLKPLGPKIDDWLLQLATLAEEHSLSTAEDRDWAHVIAGDAYHWLGHLAEDRGEWALALDYHWKSLANYEASSITHSSMINFLLTRDHAKFHVVRAAGTLGREVPASIANFKQKRLEGEPEFAPAWAEYKSKIRSLGSSCQLYVSGF